MNAVATEKDNDPLSRFRENIQKQIADQIGNLMPEDVMKKLIEDSLMALLYQSQPKYRGLSYDAPQSYIQNTVDKFMHETMRGMVHEVLEEKKPEIFELMKQQIVEQFPTMVATLLTSLYADNTQHFTMSIVNHLRSNIRV